MKGIGRIFNATLGLGLGALGISSRSPPLTLDEGYLLTATLPDLQHGIAPLGPPALAHHGAHQDEACLTRKLEM